MHSLNTAIILTTSVLNSVIILITISKKSSAAFKSPTIFFIGSTLSLIIWGACNYMADSASTPENGLFWTRASFPSAAAMELFFLYFSVNFPQRISRFRAALSIETALACLILAFSFSDAIIRSVQMDPAIGVSDIVIGPLYLPYTLYIIVILIHVIFNLILQHRIALKNEKGQARLLVIGWIFFSLGAVLTNLILPLLTGNADWSKFGPLFSVIMVVFVAYAVIYHHFLDIYVVIQRGLIYTILFSFVISTYLGLIYGFGFIIGQTTSAGYFLSGAIIALLGTFAAQPLERFFQRMTDHIFFKDRYDLASAIWEIGDIARKKLDIRGLMLGTSQAIEETVRSESVSFLFFSKKIAYHDRSFRPISSVFPIKEIDAIRNQREITVCTGLSCKSIIRTRPSVLFVTKEQPILSGLHSKKRISVIVPLFMGRSLIGTIIIGPKRSGDRYSEEDLRLFDTTAPHIATALEKARLYEEERKHARQLEKRVEHRTKEIARLQEEQRDTMIDIAHNLQSPLTIIKNVLDLIPSTETIGGSQPSNIDIAKRAIDRVSRYIYDLLTIARFEAINRNALFSETSLSELLCDLCEEYGIIAEGEGIALKKSIPGNITVSGNRHLLEQLFSNLLGNAVKYIGNGEKKIISVKLRTTDGKITVSISDTGIGIPQENISKLFSRYHRATQDLITKGSGLGLAICQKIATLHGGSISVHSDPGKGSDFIVSFEMADKKNP